MATEISEFIPQETKDIWENKIPMGREGEAHELNGTFFYLASNASSYTTGGYLGWRILPAINYLRHDDLIWC